MSTRPAGESYDWTFNYKLSRPVYCKCSKDDSTIKFQKDSNNNLTGFRIKVKNKTDPDASEISKMKADKLEKILTILSGMELKALPEDTLGIPYKPGLRRVHKSFIVKYDIEGSIDKVDTTDPNIRNIINRDVNPALEYLCDAVVHKGHGRYSEAIKEAFRVIDEKRNVNYYSKIVPDYNKYKCIRDILSHREGQQLYRTTMNYFTNYFRPVHDKFDFMHYDNRNRKIIFDSDSPKTKKTLERVAKDLIGEVRVILGL